jgi:hypothetical protein
MRRGVVMSLMGALLIAGLARAAFAQDLMLDWRLLRSEMTHNRKLATYIERNGCPDVARVRFLSDEPPWDEYQVTLDYFGLRKQISFARAIILGDPSIHLEKAERPLTDQEIATLEAMPHPKCGMGLATVR